MREFITSYEIKSHGKWIHIANVTHDNQTDAINWKLRQQELFPNDETRFTTRIVNYSKTGRLHGIKEIRRVCSPINS